ncbi:MarR family winged helix-turn-helix transcriptional regulator [Subtercola boreus]|uniref:MarR family winged helix-turn-helix transcriptional regulator n=1 Tax=Subtercola boreus TaxID=120213 RepID=UPI0011752D7B|nr:MarR family winged helix-turn-helix transcriptional regulator [Subtercola boreus]TQL56114.1 MarR family transcriptional regulator [Subtercola boreus]
MGHRREPVIPGPETTLDHSPAAATPEAAGVAGRVDRLEQQFATLFDSYRQRLRQQATAIDPALQPSGYRTVLALIANGPSKAGPLADALGFDKSVLSRQLHQLEGLGLVSRAQDVDDGRAVILSATPYAMSQIQSIRGSRRDEFRTRLSRWDETDLDTLSRLLGNLALL